jgi:hypothetical protein
MPLYDIRNTKTGEIKEVMKSIAKMQDYLKENPDFVIHIGQSPNLCDPTRLTATTSCKPDGSFKDLVSHIHRKTPGSVLDKTSNYVR